MVGHLSYVQGATASQLAKIRHLSEIRVSTRNAVSADQTVSASDALAGFVRSKLRKAGRSISKGPGCDQVRKAVVGEAGSICP